MLSNEVAGYLQIVIGLIGIVLTLINIRTLVPDVELFAQRGAAPPGLDNFSGFIRILIVLLLLLLMAFLLAMGFSVTLSAAYFTLGAKFPLLSSSMTILSLASLAITIAMALYKYRFWVAAFVGTLGAAICAIVAAVNPDLAAFWGTLTGFLILFGLTGLGTLASYLE